MFSLRLPIGIRELQSDFFFFKEPKHQLMVLPGPPNNELLG